MTYIILIRHKLCNYFFSGPAVIAQPLYQTSTADLDLEDGVQYVTLEEFFNDKSEIVTSTNQGTYTIFKLICEIISKT